VVRRGAFKGVSQDGDKLNAAQICGANFPVQNCRLSVDVGIPFFGLDCMCGTSGIRRDGRGAARDPAAWDSQNFVKAVVRHTDRYKNKLEANEELPSSGQVVMSQNVQPKRTRFAQIACTVAA